MTQPVRITLALLCALLALGGCSGDRAGDRRASADDPALSDALADPIMVDPELAEPNQAGAGLAAHAPSGALPPLPLTPEAAAAARAEALALVGGALAKAPAPQIQAAVAAAVAPRQLAELRGIGAACARRLDYSAAWAAKLPATLPVYPQGAVQEAAGVDGEGCSLRAVRFLTPVPPRDAIDFYYARARAAGFGTRYRMEGKDHALDGRKGPAAYVVLARALDGGATEVELLIDGG